MAVETSAVGLCVKVFHEIWLEAVGRGAGHLDSGQLLV